MYKLLFDLTKHEDDKVGVFASTFQTLRFYMSRDYHSPLVTICKEARQKISKEKSTRRRLEEGKTPKRRID